LERGKRTFGDQSLNCRPNAFGILHDFVRAEPNDAPAQALHHRRTPRICLDFVSVMIAVDLNDQPFRLAGEVGEVRSDRMLTTEFDAFHSMRTDQLPTDALCAAGIVPELTCLV
jgi:hypothetical protein